MKKIAELPLDFVDESDQCKKVTVGISAPFFDNEKEAWACEISFTGRFENPVYICGEDSFQALCLAMEFIQITLRNESAKHQCIRFHGTDAEWPSAAYFPYFNQVERNFCSSCS